ncbi:DUF2846 domain-containing protein [Sphingomonas bacterium]|uniref:DUF2846 domain-containing protein n=1 Tax=Sphingomonas bacterium TaxID=1895847 RepID=UPI0015767572|nr:DUF2846 domain-containing protein [Sphingomonas bacterium]
MLLLLALLAADVPKPGSDSAQVVVFRSGTLVGGAISCAVHEGGAKLTSLPPGRYAVLSVTPGPHDLVVASEAKDTFKIDAQPGATYYAKCTVGAGFMAGHPHLTSSTEAEFVRMSEKLRPVIGGSSTSK